MRKEIVKFIVLLLVALGAGPVGASFWQWSTTAGSNDSADPAINWREGMAPSAINDSSRAMMAVLAAYRNDNSGQLVTSGTSTAYTLTTSQPFASTSDMNNQTIAFTVTPTNGASPTLNVNSIGAFPLVSAGGNPIPAGTLLDGVIYRVTFTLGQFKVNDFLGSSFTIPLGGILWSTSPTAPNSNFVAPYGQCISTTTYATYWAQQGSPASGSCPGGQFAIIDMRGMVPAALDTLPGSTAGNHLTSASTGCGTAMTSVGAKCANGVEGSVITLAQVPTGITSTNPGGIPVTVNSGRSDIHAGIGNTSPSNPGTNEGVITKIQVTSTGTIGAGSVNVTSNNTSGVARPNVPPLVGLIPYLRIL